MKFCCLTASRALFACLAFLAVYSTANAQVTSLSPYSRFGIGSILAQGGAVHHSLGGGTAGVVDNFTVNLDNPASYSFLYTTTFDVGARATLLQLESSSETQKLNFASVNRISMVFKRQGGKFGYGIGLVPYSTTGYSITDTQVFDEFGEVNFTYDGEGGINKANFGVGYRLDLEAGNGLFNKEIAPYSVKIRHNIAFGSNFNYYFGSLEQTRRVLFADPGNLHTRIATKTTMSDFDLSLGVMGLINLANRYKKDVKTRQVDLTFGITYEIGQDFSSNFEELTETVQFYQNSELVVDTALWIQDLKGTLRLPEKMGVGIGLRWYNKASRQFNLLLDYSVQDWSKFQGQFGTESDFNTLAKASKLSSGFEFIPKPNRTTYRLGFRSTQTYLQFDSYQIAESAVSAGLSLPMAHSHSRSRMNLGMEVGQRGTTDNQLLKESFMNFYVGFSLTPHFFNNWFVERKYD